MLIVNEAARRARREVECYETIHNWCRYWDCVQQHDWGFPATERPYTVYAETVLTSRLWLPSVLSLSVAPRIESLIAAHKRRVSDTFAADEADYVRQQLATTGTVYADTRVRIPGYTWERRVLLATDGNDAWAVPMTEHAAVCPGEYPIVFTNYETSILCEDINKWAPWVELTTTNTRRILRRSNLEETPIIRATGLLKYNPDLGVLALTKR